MGHIGRKLPPQLLGVALFGDIEDQQDNAGHLIVGEDGAGHQLIFAVAVGQGGLGMLAGAGPEQHILDFLGTVHRQDIPAHSILVGTQEPGRRLIDAENLAGSAQQRQTLTHGAGDHVKFMLLLLQFCQLVHNLPMLPLNAAQQRRNLFIRLIGQRIVQIQSIEGLHNLFGQAAGQQRRQQAGGQQHHRRRLEHHQQEADQGILDRRHADNGVILQPLRRIDHTGQQRGGIVLALSIAVSHGLLDLFPVQMIFHFGGVGVGVIEHCAVLVNPGDTIPPDIQLLQVIHALIFHGMGHQVRLNFQLLVL